MTSEAAKPDPGPTEIRLIVPARTEFLRLSRLNASTIGAELGFDVDGIDDLRIAVDEACAAITNPPGSDTIELVFRPDDHGLAIEAYRRAEALPELAMHELAETILAATVDDYELGDHDGARSFRLLKRLPGVVDG